MISFRKHAAESTRRPNSFLKRAAGRAHVAALTCLLLLCAQAQAFASPQKETRPEARPGAPAAEAPKAQGREEEAGGEESAGQTKIPVRVRRVNTPGGPGIFATIGEFPTDLNEAGQEFLKREFFEHFASDVLGLGEADTPGATLKIAMLPQEKDNQREGDFTFGKLSGHMVVLVEKRRVLIACTFSENERVPQLLAGSKVFGQQKSDS